MGEYRKTQIRLDLIEFCVLAGLSAGSYMGVVLRASGMDSLSVGTIMSANALIGLLMPPMFGMLSDKVGSPRKTMMVLLCATTLIWIGIPMTASVRIASIPLVVVFLLVGAVCQMPCGSLLDSWLMQIQESDPRIVYAHARKYGSLGFSLMAIAATFITGNFGPASIYLIMIAFLPIIYVLSKRVGDPAPIARSEEDAHRLQLGRLFKNRDLMTHFLSLIIFWMPFALHNTLLPYLITDIGASPSLHGTVIGVRAFMEVPAFLLVPYFLRRFQPRALLPIAFLWYAIECVALSLSHSIPMLYLIMACSGSVFAVIVGVNIAYVHGLAPAGLKATAVTMNGAMMSCAGILGNLLSGYLVDRIGVRSCLLILCAMVLAVVALRVVMLVIGTRRNREQALIAAGKAS